MNKTCKLLLACLVLVYVGCRDETLTPEGDTPKRPDRLVTTIGAHEFYDGELVLNVHQEDGKLNYRITRRYNEGPFPQESAEPVRPFIKVPQSDWFAFAESVDTVWIFNGQDVLNLVEIFDEGGVRMSDSVGVPNIVRRAPKAVRDSLPKPFLEKFKEK